MFEPSNGVSTSAAATNSPDPMDSLNDNPAWRAALEKDLEKATDAPLIVPRYTGFVYDIQMAAHIQPPESRPEGDDEVHPEKPERILGIVTALQKGGCIERMRRIKIREVLRKEVLLVHTEDQWRKVQIIERVTRDEIRFTNQYYGSLSLYICPATTLAAKLSCGGVIETALAVMDPLSNIRNAFAIVRPPGHHAEPDEHMGFCFFNNVAVAAKVIQEKMPGTRSVIIDWDVHHGNGTQKAFYSDPSILYISIHRYDYGDFYPGGTYGAASMVGDGPGLGRNINIAWNGGGGFNDADYLYAFQRLIMPICYEFAPDLVLVSAGFDAARGDLLGGCDVTPAGYSHMLHMLSGLAGGKVVVALEGGYNVDAISQSALACTRVLLGDPPEQLGALKASARATAAVFETAKIHSKYWKNMVPRAPPPKEEFQEFEDSIHSLSDLLSAHRKEHLYNAFRLYPLPIAVEKLEAIFRHRICVSEDIMDESVSLAVLFVHDLGTLNCDTGPTNNVDVDLEFSYLLDTSNKILELALGNPEEGIPSLGGHGVKVGVIDVDLPTYFPAYLLDDDEKQITTPKDQAKIHLEQLKYIWDNLIEIRGNDLKVILIGHGSGCAAIMSLINARDVEHMVKAVIQVHGLDKPISLRNPEPSKQQWFTQCSMAILPPDHPHLLDKRTKRFGRATISTETKPLLVLHRSIDMIRSFIEDLVPPAKQKKAEAEEADGGRSGVGGESVEDVTSRLEAGASID